MTPGVQPDFLVIGSGVAGLRAAIELAARGEVLVVGKGRSGEGSTEYAQGGIAAALGGPSDLAAHFQDTLRVGRGLCREEAVRVLVEEGPDQIRTLIAWGARFDEDEERPGRFLLTREGGHSRARIFRARGDATGEELLRVLRERARAMERIRFAEGKFTVDLEVSDRRCTGAILLDEATGRLERVVCRAVILAAGGAGQLYERTTNPPSATGDGLALAWRAGAVLEDMEFFQFHPTALRLEGAPAFLLTEAMRGEGGRLFNDAGERFMPRHHRLAELAPRDVVSRAIRLEMERTGTDRVWLDVRHLGAEALRCRFPRIDAVCRRYGIDIGRDRIPVSPAAHFMMGGVKTDLDGATTLPGLFAAGEVACTGVHGANRLGSNSLLEGLVFGARAGRAAARRAADRPARAPADRALPDLDASTPLDPEIRRLRQELRRMMWARVGLVRTEEGLTHAVDQLAEWAGRWEGRAPAGRVEPKASNRAEWETLNLIMVGRLVAGAALARRGSVGAHFRADFPRKERRWREHRTASIAPAKRLIPQ